MKIIKAKHFSCKVSISKVIRSTINILFYNWIITVIFVCIISLNFFLLSPINLNELDSPGRIAFSQQQNDIRGMDIIIKNIFLFVFLSISINAARKWGINKAQNGDKSFLQILKSTFSIKDNEDLIFIFKEILKKCFFLFLLISILCGFWFFYANLKSKGYFLYWTPSVWINIIEGSVCGGILVAGIIFLFLMLFIGFFSPFLLFLGIISKEKSLGENLRYIIASYKLCFKEYLYSVVIVLMLNTLAFSLSIKFNFYFVPLSFSILVSIIFQALYYGELKKLI